MMSLFTIASNDQSVFYLGQLFGSVGTVLQPNGSGSSVLNIVGTMFKTINTTALVLGALLVTYTTVVGLLKSAHEGQFLGKEWSSMWVPMRMVLGIAALFPTGLGYSAIQIVMMWFILQGVGAADTLWNVILNYVSVMGSPYASVSIPTQVGISHDMKTLFQALTCDNAARRTDSASWATYANPDSSGPNLSYYYCADPANAGNNFCNANAGQPQPKLSTVLASPQTYPTICNFNTTDKTVTCGIGPVAPGSAGAGACGSITMGDLTQVQCPGDSTNSVASQITCAAFKGQQTILTDPTAGIVPYLETIAGQLNDMDNGYMYFYQSQSPTPVVNAPPSNPSTSTTFIKNYCGNNQIADSGCCVYTPPSSSLLPASKCPTQASNTFPYINGDVGNATNSDYTNLNISSGSANSEGSVIWSCGLGPYLASNTSTCLQGTTKDEDFITSSVNNYTVYVNAQVQAVLTAVLLNPITITGAYQDASNMGWLMAGAYYYKLASANNNNQKAAVPTFSVATPNPTLGSSSNSLSKYRNNYSAAGTIATNIMSQTGGGGTSAISSAPGAGEVNSALNGSANGIINDFMGAMGTGANNPTGGQATNPLVAIQHTGESLLINAQTLYAVTLAIFIIVLIAAKINAIGLGTGLTDNPFAAAGLFLANSIYTAIIAFVAWCITLGGTLAIYTPLIPYTIFVFGSIGWFCQVIEAMVAGPFIALGILAPGGGHELLGHAHKSLMMALDIFLRPLLMVTGMIFAMLLSSVAVSIINAGFKGVMGDIDASPGLPELIMFCTAYTMLVLTALNKCFALIHLLPENVLTWIGGQGRAAGEAEAVSAAKGGVEAGGGLAASQASSHMAGAKDADEKGMEAIARKNKSMEDAGAKRK